jgi:hypothetical protein
MLQVLHLDVSKINWMLHMECVWEAGGDARGHMKCRHEQAMSG